MEWHDAGSKFNEDLSAGSQVISWNIATRTW
jgi:hypothetical protein